MAVKTGKVPKWKSVVGKIQRKSRALESAPIAAPPKRRGRPVRQLPDHGGVDLPSDSRAYDHHIPVKFGGSVSASGHGMVGTRKIGVTIGRGQVDARTMTRLFVGATLSVMMQASPSTQVDVVGQAVMDCGSIEKCAVAFSPRLSESPRKFSASLCFDKNAVSAVELEQFCGADGTLHCTILESPDENERDEA